MRIVVLGAQGMLGSALVAELITRGLDVVALGREQCNVTSRTDLAEHLFGAGLVFNCAGCIPERCADHLDMHMVRINTLAPHYVADIAGGCGVRVIHVSTDCVYDSSDTASLYARSKLAGESPAPWVTNVRTSFIGFEHGLLAWLLQQPVGARVEGWWNARWSGSTVWEIARGLADMVARTDLPNITRLATPEPNSKYGVVRSLVRALALPLEVEVAREPEIDRSMVPDVELAPFATALPELVERYHARMRCG